MEYITHITSNFLDIMSNGGPIMWVILSVAIIAMMLLSWESLYVLSLSRNAQRDYSNLKMDIAYIPTTKNNWSNSPIAQLFDKLNWLDIKSKEDVVKEFNIHITDIMPKMNNSLATIGTLATLLPMLGLLGTVTGMINVFEVIAIKGNGEADAMASGISQALLTTASGLIIAIPVIFFHQLLANRVKALMDVTGQAMQVVLHRDISFYKGARSNA